MPRASGARKSSSPAPAARAPPPQQHAPAPAPQAAAPAPAPAQGGGMMSGLAGTMMSGMATGVGFSMANRAVDAVMGPRQTEVVHRQEEAPAPAAPAAAPVASGKCGTEYDLLTRCLKDAGSPSDCNSYNEMFKRCNESA